LGKVVVFGHGDLDGLCCVALLLDSLKDREVKVYFAQPFDLASRIERDVKDIPEEMYFLDLALSNPKVLGFLENFRKSGCKVIYIDHHGETKETDILNCSDVTVLGVHGNVSCSMLVYKWLKSERKDLAELGALGDKVLIDKRHKLFGYAETLRASLVLNPKDDDFRHHIVKLLVDKSYVDEEVKMRAKLTFEKIVSLSEVALHKIIHETNFGVIIDLEELKDLYGYAGKVASDLVMLKGKHVFLTYTSPEDSEKIIIVARGHKKINIDCGETIANICKKFEGFGGGHKLASAGNINKKYKQQLIDELKKILA